MTTTHPVRDDIDLLDGHWYANEPHDTWEWMRRNAPVYYDPKGDVWAITRHADVLAIEKDPKTFSSKRSPRPHGAGLPMMISMDDPLHTRRRRLVYHGFTPKRVRDKEPAIRRICTQIIDNVCERGECDFVWDIAAPLPLLLIADMYLNEGQRYVGGHFPTKKPAFFDKSKSVQSFTQLPASEPKFPQYACDGCPSTGNDAIVPAANQNLNL